MGGYKDVRLKYESCFSADLCQNKDCDFVELATVDETWIS